MEIKLGYLYHIKDEFFTLFKDDKLMQNHENGNKRPTYFALKDKELLWFIPISSKVSKYEKIVQNKIKKYGVCNTILIREILGKKHAILIQNAFPILECYIDHVHTINGNPIKVIETLKTEILNNFQAVLRLKENGIDLFFTDIDKIKLKLLNKKLIKN